MSVIIRLQNLPWSASAMDIRHFFKGLGIPPGGVHIIGGEKGDAFIAFSTDEDARQAMMLNQNLLNENKVSLFLSSKTEMQNTITQAKAASGLGGGAPPLTGPKITAAPVIAAPQLSASPQIQNESNSAPAVSTVPGQVINQPPISYNSQTHLFPAAIDAQKPYDNRFSDVSQPNVQTSASNMQYGPSGDWIQPQQTQPSTRPYGFTPPHSVHPGQTPSSGPPSVSYGMSQPAPGLQAMSTAGDQFQVRPFEQNKPPPATLDYSKPLPANLPYQNAPPTSMSSVYDQKPPPVRLDYHKTPTHQPTAGYVEPPGDIFQAGGHGKDNFQGYVDRSRSTADGRPSTDPRQFQDLLSRDPRMKDHLRPPHELDMHRNEPVTDNQPPILHPSGQTGPRFDLHDPRFRGPPPGFLSEPRTFNTTGLRQDLSPHDPRARGQDFRRQPQDLSPHDPRARGQDFSRPPQDFPHHDLRARSLDFSRPPALEHGSSRNSSDINKPHIGEEVFRGGQQRSRWDIPLHDKPEDNLSSRPDRPSDISSESFSAMRMDLKSDRRDEASTVGRFNRQQMTDDRKSSSWSHRQDDIPPPLKNDIPLSNKPDLHSRIINDGRPGILGEAPPDLFGKQFGRPEGPRGHKPSQNIPPYKRHEGSLSNLMESETHLRRPDRYGDRPFESPDKQMKKEMQLKRDDSTGHGRPELPAKSQPDFHTKDIPPQQSILGGPPPGMFGPPPGRFPSIPSLGVNRPVGQFNLERPAMTLPNVAPTQRGQIRGDFSPVSFEVRQGPPTQRFPRFSGAPDISSNGPKNLAGGLQTDLQSSTRIQTMQLQTQSEQGPGQNAGKVLLPDPKVPQHQAEKENASNKSQKSENEQAVKEFEGQAKLSKGGENQQKLFTDAKGGNIQQQENLNFKANKENEKGTEDRGKDKDKARETGDRARDRDREEREKNRDRDRTRDRYQEKDRDYERSSSRDKDRDRETRDRDRSRDDDRNSRRESRYSDRYGRDRDSDRDRYGRDRNDDYRDRYGRDEDRDRYGRDRYGRDRDYDRDRYGRDRDDDKDRYGRDRDDDRDRFGSDRDDDRDRYGRDSDDDRDRYGRDRDDKRSRYSRNRDDDSNRYGRDKDDDRDRYGRDRDDSRYGKEKDKVDDKKEKKNDVRDSDSRRQESVGSPRQTNTVDKKIPSRQDAKITSVKQDERKPPADVTQKPTVVPQDFQPVVTAVDSKSTAVKQAPLNKGLGLLGAGPKDQKLEKPNSNMGLPLKEDNRNKEERPPTDSVRVDLQLPKPQEPLNKQPSDLSGARGIKRSLEQPVLTVVIRNMPKAIGYRDVRKFFAGCEIPRDGLKLINDSSGQRIGVAAVKFGSEQSFRKALSMHGKLFDKNPVEIVACAGFEFENAIDSYLPPTDDDEPEDHTKRPRLSPKDDSYVQYIVQLRGLDADVKKEDIRKFLNDSKIEENGKAIYIDCDENFQCTGTVMVELVDKNDFDCAVRKNNQKLGSKGVNIVYGTVQQLESLKQKLNEIQRKALEKPRPPPEMPRKSSEPPEKPKLTSRPPDKTMDVQKRSEDKSRSQPQPEAIGQSGAKVNILDDANRDFDYGNPPFFSVHMTNLPQYAFQRDIREFFHGLEVAPRGLQVAHDALGNSMGEAFVEFTSRAYVENALKKDGLLMGPNKVYVRPIRKIDMINKLRKARSQYGPYSRPSPDSERAPEDQGRSSVDSGPPPFDRNRPPLLETGRKPFDHNRQTEDLGEPPFENNGPPVEPGRPPFDHSRPMMDHNRPPFDYDRPQVDRGRAPFDSNRPPPEYGRAPFDHNRPPSDHGQPIFDPNRPQIEHGRPLLDHNRPLLPMDYGGPPRNSGRPPFDHGRLPRDQGRPPMDRGRPPMDRGRPPLLEHGRPPRHQGPMEYGRPYMDHGRPPYDHGRTSGEHGRPPMDHGRQPMERGRFSEADSYHPEAPQGACFVVASNLPERTSIGEILNFFRGYNVVPETVRTNVPGFDSEPGSVTALIGFKWKDDAMKAIDEKNGEILKGREVKLRPDSI